VYRPGGLQKNVNVLTSYICPQYHHKVFKQPGFLIIIIFLPFIPFYHSVLMGYECILPYYLAFLTALLVTGLCILWFPCYFHFRIPSLWGKDGSFIFPCPNKSRP
jgi:hypothetical protein